MASFVFLEIRDRDLNFLFSGIHRVLYGSPPAKAAHLTIRGPYKRGVPPSMIRECRRKLEHDVLTISEVGQFSNPREGVVFLRVGSPNLRRVWWKPDYPLRSFGFNPHISLFRSDDRDLVERVHRFFLHEGLDLKCAEFLVTPYVSRQLEIFPGKLPEALVATGRVRLGLLDRLDTVVKRHRRRWRESSES